VCIGGIFAVDQKISALVVASPAALTHETAINEAGTSKKVTLQKIADLLGTDKMALASAYTNNSTTGTAVTGFTRTLVAGTYSFSYFLIARSAAATTAIGFGINYTGTATSLVAYLSYVANSNTTAANTEADDVVTGVGAEMLIVGCVANTESTTSPNLNSLNGFVTVGSDTAMIIEGIIDVSDGGDLELWANSSVASSQVDIRAGSSLCLTRLR